MSAEKNSKEEILLELQELKKENALLKEKYENDFRELKQMEEKLKCLSLRQEAILSSVSDIIMEVDSNKIYTWANQAGIQFFGEDVIGKEAASFFEGEQQTYQFVQPLFNGSEELFYVESWQRRKDGEKRLLSWWCKVLKDGNGNVTGSLSSARDITEQKQAGKIFEDLVDNNPMSIHILDVNGFTLKVNAAHTALFGSVPPPEYSFFKHFRIDKKEVSGLLERVKKGEIVHFPDFYFNAHDFDSVLPDVPVTIRMIAFPLNDSTGKPERFVLMHEDVTIRRKAEEEILRLNAELEQRVIERTNQLEESYKELESFSYSVSHDLRAPLRHISGFSDLLKSKYQDSLPEKGVHYVNTIIDSVRKMGVLIDDLLMFSRMGKAEIQHSILDINQIVRDTVEFLINENPERKINWDISDLPQAYGDSSMIKLVWMNLISNAVKFTKTREIANIKIWAKEENNELLFFIKDNGVGFDMKYYDKLFNVFQRLHSAEEFEGTGIGLANVYRIVVRHFGKIYAEAELDKGAVFCFSLPKCKENKNG